MNKKRGLGRGLDALLSSGAEYAAQARGDQDRLKTIAVDLIQRGQYQPRTDMHQESLQDLAASIRSQGIVQPIVVRPLSAPGRYEIIAGERRWRAAQLAGLHEVPAIIRDVTDHAAMSIALIENIQREQLNPIEEAQGLARLIGEFEMTHQQVADAVGRSRASVTNLLRLLDLAEEVKQLLVAGRLEMGHARALVGLPGEVQLQCARQIVDKGLSVRQAEHLARQAKAGKPNRKSARPPADPNLETLQRDLSDRIGCRVTIRHGARGAGTLSIHYHSLDELDGVLEHLK